MQQIQKQPKGLNVLFLIELWERFGFYIFSGLLVLFMSKKLMLPDATAYSLFAAVIALLYVGPSVGGYIADNFIGYKRSLIIGAVLLVVGYYLLAIPSTRYLYFALATIVVGASLFKFVPSTILTGLYSYGDKRIESGFTIFYMGINVGSFAAFLFGGFIAERFGWYTAFFVAGSGVIIGLLTYIFFQKYVNTKLDALATQKLSWLCKGSVFFGIIAAVILCEQLLLHVAIANTAVFLIGIVLFGYVLLQFKTLQPFQRKKLLAALILIIIAIMFFILYFQQPMSVLLFVDRNVDRQILGFHIPAASFQTLNPIGIMIFSPLLAILYNKLNHNEIKVSIAVKFALGTLLVGVGYLLLTVSTYFADSHSMVNSGWLVASYFFQDIAELLVSALGLAMIAQLAPRKLLGVMMGMWFLSQAVGSVLAGVFAKWTAVPKIHMLPSVSLHIYGHCFAKFGWISIIVGLLGLVLVKPIMKLANSTYDVKDEATLSEAELS